MRAARVSVRVRVRVKVGVSLALALALDRALTYTRYARRFAAKGCRAHEPLP